MWCCLWARVCNLNGDCLTDVALDFRVFTCSSCAGLSSHWIHTYGRIGEQTCPQGTVRRWRTRRVVRIVPFHCTLFFSQVDRVLPRWLAEPDVIHRDIKNNLVCTSDVSGLSAQLLKNLQNNGIHHFFPGDGICVQQQLRWPVTYSVDFWSRKQVNAAPVQH